MKKAKKILVISLIFILVIAGITVALGLFINSIRPKTYTSAKKECQKILAKYQIQMEDIASNALELKTNTSGVFEKYSYFSNKKEGFVTFDIDAQGMLGGQYWELVYTQDGILYGDTESYLYEEPRGNNIVRAEKLDDHWWYLWTDYDGTEKSYK